MDLNFPVLTALDDGRVLAIGAPDATNATSKVLVFDPVGQSWRPLPNPPKAVDGATVTPLQDGRVLVVGGYGSTRTGPLGSASPSPAADAFLLDLRTESWSVTASMGAPRAGASAIRLASGEVLVSGGFGGQSDQAPFLPSLSRAELFNPSKGAWQETAPMAHARADHASGLVGGRVFVVGGTDQAEAVGSAEEFDPATNSWSPLPDMPALRSAPTVYVVGGKVVVIGGGAANSAGVFDPNPSLDAEIFDTASRQWSVGSPLQTTDRFPVLVDVVPLADGRVFGVLAGTGFAYTYDPGTDVWTPATSAPMASAIQPYLLGPSEASALKDGEVLMVVGTAAQEFDPNGTRPDPQPHGLLDSMTTATVLGSIAVAVLLLLLLRRLREPAPVSPR